MFEKREIEGRWWRLGKPSEALYGIMRYDPENGITLETKDVRSYELRDVITNDEPLFEKCIVFGRDNHDRSITLFDCFAEGRQSSTGLKTTTFTASTAIMGRDFAGWTDVQFDGLRLDFMNLFAWLNLNTTEHVKIEDGIPYVGFKSAEDLIFPLLDKAELRINASTSGSSTRMTHEHVRKFTESRFLELRWAQRINMKAVNEWILQLQRFLSLMMGFPTYPRWIKGLLNGEVVAGMGERAVSKELEVLRINRGISSVRQEKHPTNMLCPFSAIRDRVGSVISNWIEYDERLGSVLDLYFSVVFNGGLYGNHQFLFLAQALERYHAVQLGKPNVQASLFLRLRDILDKRGDLVKDVVEEFPDFPKLVKDTRNYYTHFDPNLLEEGRVANGVDLSRLVQSMRILLEVLFLSDLGIGDDAISKAKNRRASMIYSIGC